MKISALFFCLFICVGFPAASQRKIALVIANGKYDVDKYGWPAIHSTNDIPLLLDFFRKQRFDTVIVKKDLTKAQMLQAFSSFYQYARPGDITFMHISSHGQQVWDEDGDETDGFDEAIVPVDCPSLPRFENTTAKHLTDDEIDRYLNRLRTKIGQQGTVILSADACNSGSVSRGTGVARGGMPAFVPNGKQAKTSGHDGGNEMFLSDNKAPAGRAMAPFVLLTAARPNERAHEHKVGGSYYGSLSYSIYQTAVQLQQGASYRAWFSQIQNNMAAMEDVPNRPQITGDVDKEVFRGRMVMQEPYYSITEVDQKNPGRITIDGGILSGLTDSTRLWLLPAGSLRADSQAALTSGYILKSENFTSEVVLNKPLEFGSGKEGSKYWLFVAEKRIRPEKILLGTDVSGLRSEMKTEKNIQWVNRPEAELFIEPGRPMAGRYCILNNILGDTLVSSTPVDSLAFYIHRYGQSKFLRSFVAEDPETTVRLRLVPVTTDSRGKFADTLPMEKVMKNGIPVFTPFDSAVLELSNMSDQVLYFNVIDIQPDGVLNALLPNQDLSYENVYLPPGKTVLFKQSIISFALPYGNEVFKVFVSRSPINLTPLLLSGGVAPKGRGNLNILEEVFASSYATGTRGAITNKVPSGSGSVWNYSFAISDKR